MSNPNLLNALTCGASMFVDFDNILAVTWKDKKELLMFLGCHGLSRPRNDDREYSNTFNPKCSNQNGAWYL